MNIYILQVVVAQNLKLYLYPTYPYMTLGTFLKYLQSPSSEADHSTTRFSAPYPKALTEDSKIRKSSHQKLRQKMLFPSLHTQKSCVFSWFLPKVSESSLGVKQGTRAATSTSPLAAFQPWPSIFSDHVALSRVAKPSAAPFRLVPGAVV